MLPPLFEMADAAADSGNQRAWRKPAAFGFACVVGVFLLAAHDGQVRHGAAYGFVLLLGAVFGLLSAFGLLTPTDDALPLSQTPWAALAEEPAWAAPRVTVPVAIALLLGQPG